DTIEGEVQYYIHVRSMCGGEGSAWITTGFKYLYGDSCFSAIDLATQTSPISSTTSGYADDFDPTCNSGTSAGPDKFYYINAPADWKLTITPMTNGYDSVRTLVYGSCGSFTQVTCADPEATVFTWTNSTGSAQNAYYIMDAWTTASGTFSFSWELTPPPVVVDSFEPAVICSNELEGTVMTVTGSNFTDATDVQIDGVSMDFTVVNDTTIEIQLVEGMTSGFVTVINEFTSGTSEDAFAITAAPVVNPIVVNGDSVLCVGHSVALSSTTPAGTWSSSNEDVATVDGNGIVTAVGAGTTTISYSVTDQGCTTAVSTTIDVNAPIESTDPAPQSVVTGSIAQFSVTATGALTYQWMVSADGENFEPVEDNVYYSGANTNTLTITNTPEDLTWHLYYVVMTGEAPCDNYETAPALLLVGDTGIDQDPTDVTLCSD